MKYIDEFRDPDQARILLQRITKLADQVASLRSTPLQIMEFCGGHTHTIFRYGIEQVIPKSIELVHGPGCPVCVLPREAVDHCVAIAERPDVIMTTFGDAMRVPGSRKNLLQAKAEGADVRMVYSPLDALSIARNSPDKEVVFFALGFETTMPSTALTLQQAHGERLQNFSVLCHHVTTPPVLTEILQDNQLQLDGFIAPGHVAMIIGEQPFQFVACDYGKPLVISGFEPVDVLQAMLMLLSQIHQGRSQVENQYLRIVRQSGNASAQLALCEVFEIGEKVTIRDRYAPFDAMVRFAGHSQSDALPESISEPSYCAEVLKGRIRPLQCPLFGKHCSPSDPQGALMVSSEGACAAYYQYGKAEAMAEI